MNPGHFHRTGTVSQSFVYNQACVGDAASWGGMSCGEIGLLSSRSKSQLWLLLLFL